MCVKTRSPRTSLLLKGQVSEHITVKCTIPACLCTSTEHLAHFFMSFIINIWFILRTREHQHGHITNGHQSVTDQRQTCKTKKLCWSQLHWTKSEQVFRFMAPMTCYSYSLTCLGLLLPKILYEEPSFYPEGMHHHPVKYHQFEENLKGLYEEQGVEWRWTLRISLRGLRRNN